VRLRLASMALLLVSCRPPSPPPDAGMEEPPEVPYEGETSGSVIPILPDVELEEEDGGELIIETRCCQLGFSIPDREPADTTGRLVGTYGPTAGAGVALVRDAGTWSAAACMPVKAGIRYWFELTLPRADAGEADGGLPEPTVLVRHDENAPAEPGFGGTANVFGPVNDCSEIDAGTGTWSP
jgi:hypothetical protein